MKLLLSAQQLQLGYGGKALLHIPSLNLYQGELIAVVGRNGQGKSTLLRALGGLLPPLAGQIQLLGLPIAHYTLQALARLRCMVLPTVLPNATMLVQEIVAAARLPYSGWLGKLSLQDELAITHSLQQVGAAEWAVRPWFTLSDGQRQRVLIARALAQQTPLMLLDEPSIYLDGPAQAELFLLLRSLTATGQRSIVLATHELELASRVVDALWLVQEGLLTAGAPEDLGLAGKLTSLQPLNNSAATSPHPIQLIAPEPAFLWAEKALSRAGFSLAPQANLGVVGAQQAADYQWTITVNGQTIASYSNLYQVVQHLKQLTLKNS